MQALTQSPLISSKDDNGSIAMWDLENPAPHDPHDDDEDLPMHQIDYEPVAYAPKTQTEHTHGITHLSFFTTDSGFMLSSSYDHTLKTIDAIQLRPSKSYNLGCVVYHHALSPLVSHFVTACALQHPAVRLVDLRTRSPVQALSGHASTAVLAVSWSPKDAHLLASAGSDGTVRLWDIRRSASCLGVLDMDDHIGLGGYDGKGLGARRKDKGVAHVGAANGVVWTEDGRYMVTTGHDARIRVWDARTCANTLTSFGPRVRNTRLGSVTPLISPRDMTRHREDVLLWPNESDILVFDLLEGTMLKRLRPLGVNLAGRGRERGRITSLAWRAGDVEIYSGHEDGLIRAWKSRSKIDAELDEEERAEEDEEVSSDRRKRKREVLDVVERPRVTFT